MADFGISYEGYWAVTQNESDALMSSLVYDLAQHDRIHVITGAGVSKASGIPTFRGNDGIYEQDDDVAGLFSEPVWGMRPALIWSKVAYLARVIGKGTVVPNLSHTTLADMEAFFDVAILTQNVDGLHQRAGSSNVTEIHGSVHSADCQSCGTRHDVIGDVLEEAASRAPICREDECRGILKPNVVLFGGFVSTESSRKAREEFQNPKVIFAIGTTAMMEHVTRYYGPYANTATTIEINPDHSSVTNLSTYSIRGRSEEVLPEIYRRLVELKTPKSNLAHSALIQ